jgi:hypothetical protein
VDHALGGRAPARLRWACRLQDVPGLRRLRAVLAWVVWCTCASPRLGRTAVVAVVAEDPPRVQAALRCCRYPGGARVVRRGAAVLVGIRLTGSVKLSDAEGWVRHRLRRRSVGIGAATTRWGGASVGDATWTALYVAVVDAARGAERVAMAARADAERRARIEQRCRRRAGGRRAREQAEGAAAEADPPSIA